jgi:hypothetical protein
MRQLDSTIRSRHDRSCSRLYRIGRAVRANMIVLGSGPILHRTVPRAFVSWTATSYSGGMCIVRAAAYACLVCSRSKLLCRAYILGDELCSLR